MFKASREKHVLLIVWWNGHDNRYITMVEFLLAMFMVECKRVLSGSLFNST